MNVQYTYHVHEGAEGSTSNGCYTNAVYHSHTNNCYKSCSGSLTKTSSSDDQYVFKCNTCGGTNYRTKHDWENNPSVRSCNLPKISCGKTTATIEKYSLGCGKTEDTIESATIIY